MTRTWTAATPRAAAPWMVALWVTAMTAVACPAGAAAPSAPATPAPPRMLEELAGRFTWRPIEEQATVVEIVLTGDPGGTWQVVPLDGGDVELRPGPAADPGFSCELDADTLARLYRGELSGITAAGKDDAGASSPVEILPGSAVPEDAPRTALAPVFHFLVHFFAAGDPERLPITREATRVLHGAHMAGLFYHPGFRSAWYSIRGDEQLNGEGDTTSYQQAFVFVRGRARMRLGQRWIEVGEGETIYVPPGTMHAIKSRDGGEVQIVWLAWGEGA